MTIGTADILAIGPILSLNLAGQPMVVITGMKAARDLIGMLIDTLQYVLLS